jgi:L-aminopeptidase/D-esterase-like protein
MAARPGPRNLITDVAGLRVGNAEDAAARTGVTVVLAETPAAASADVRGGAPGTRETDLLEPGRLVGAVDAVVLAGGSVYGLGAADAVTAWLGARGRGFRLREGAPTAPIVPAAILFDLANGGDKAWGEAPPYGRLGATAAAAAAAEFGLGTAGAGYGAMAGALKGGLGSASAVTEDGYTVGALTAVNSFGSVVAPGGRSFWAAPFEVGGEFGGLGPAALAGPLDDWGLAKTAPAPRENTTLAVVATDAILAPTEARRLAVMAQDGLARAIRPVHTPFDGDVVFALATGRRPLSEPAGLTLARLGALAADVLARAVARGVHAAEGWPGAPAWRDLPA